jgi:hypothetical protein
MPNDQEWEDEHEWWEEYVDLCLECPTEPKENVYHVLPGYIPNIIAEATCLERARIRKDVEGIRGNHLDCHALLDEVLKILDK